MDTATPVATGTIAMRDLPWKDFLHAEHCNEILAAHKKEIDGLTGMILKELFPGDDEYRAAQRGTNCRLILEFKRVGVWNREDCVALDGEDFKYDSGVAGLTAICNVVFDPIRRNNDGTLEDVTLSSIDIAYAYLQSDPFPASFPPRYLKIKDPVTGTRRFFRQYGVLYGSRSFAVRWQQTLHPWLVSKGFVQGASEPCAFYHKERKITVLSYITTCSREVPGQMQSGSTRNCRPGSSVRSHNGSARISRWITSGWRFSRTLRACTFRWRTTSRPCWSSWE